MALRRDISQTLTLAPHRRRLYGAPDHREHQSRLTGGRILQLAAGPLPVSASYFVRA
jgi:hypothetical protein